MVFCKRGIVEILGAKKDGQRKGEEGKANVGTRGRPERVGTTYHVNRWAWTASI
jgi:hypothetical protein